MWCIFLVASVTHSSMLESLLQLNTGVTVTLIFGKRLNFLIPSKSNDHYKISLASWYLLDYMSECKLHVSCKLD